MDGHATSASTHAKILGALLALTVITVLAAGFNFGSWNIVIALGIASVKASLVALFFMHLRHDKPMSAIIFVTGAAMLGVFLMICSIDSDARADAAVRPSTPAFNAPRVPSLPAKQP